MNRNKKLALCAINDEIAMDIRFSKELTREMLEVPKTSEDERALLFKRMLEIAERELDKKRLFVPVTGVDPMTLANRIADAPKWGEIVPVDLSNAYDDITLIDEPEIANVT